MGHVQDLIENNPDWLSVLKKIFDVLRQELHDLGHVVSDDLQYVDDIYVRPRVQHQYTGLDYCRRPSGKVRLSYLHDLYRTKSCPQPKNGFDQPKLHSIALAIHAEVLLRLELQQKSDRKERNLKVSKKLANEINKDCPKGAPLATPCAVADHVEILGLQVPSEKAKRLRDAVWKVLSE